MSARREYAVHAPRTGPRPPCPATVRRGVAHDVEAAAALSLTVAHGTSEQWRERLQRDIDLPDRELVVADVTGELVGYARLGHVVPGPGDAAPEGVYLTGLVVAARWRRQGVGEALVRHACELAASLGDVLWSFYDERNLASADLHARLGFREVRRGDIGFPGTPPGSRDVLVRRPV